MKFRMQVKTDGVWKDVAPTNGAPYEFKTYQDAYDVLVICYPDQVKFQDRNNLVVRIANFNGEAANEFTPFEKES